MRLLGYVPFWVLRGMCILPQGSEKVTETTLCA